jgi:tRNA pseudouridine38-40 synthase
MARYQIILAYDGTGFVGSQRQAKSRTVQGECEKALRNIGWQGKSILLAGRTDTGTHASGQVAAFDLEWGHGEKRLQDALNANLPGDMSVQAVSQVADGFHPRYDAVSRCYRYRLFCDEIRQPLRERYAWRVWPPVGDLGPLAAIWVGKHDFASFGSPTHEGGTTSRTVFHAEWRRSADEWTFEVRADAFLYRMVRRLVYVQVVVGQGRLPLEVLVQGLEKGTLVPVGLAPACGLSLVDVSYDHPVEERLV